METKGQTKATLQKRIHAALSWLSVSALIMYFAHSQYASYIRSNERERAREERIEQLVSEVKEMTERNRANWEWPRLIAGKSSVRISPVLTVEVQEQWLKDEPILFIGVLKDISKNTDGTYQIRVARQSISNDATFLGSDILVEANCDPTRTEPLLNAMKHTSRLSIVEDLAMVAKIHQISSTIGRSADGLPTTIVVGHGECRDVIVLPYSLPNNWQTRLPKP